MSVELIVKVVDVHSDFVNKWLGHQVKSSYKKKSIYR